jgi:hypothetical protein
MFSAAAAAGAAAVGPESVLVYGQCHLQLPLSCLVPRLIAFFRCIAQTCHLVVCFGRCCCSGAGVRAGVRAVPPQAAARAAE